MRKAKELGRAHGVTLNDLVLMLASSALRRHYTMKRKPPRKSPVAAVPITLREKGDTEEDNQASLSLVSLGTHIADPLQRLAHIKVSTAAMKSTMGGLKSILPTDLPSIGMPWLIEAATALYGRAKFADRGPRLTNLVISNVPVPPLPLCVAGARMLINYPTSIIVHGMALNITVQRYDQSLDFVLMADAVAMPDVRDLADAIQLAFDDLRLLPRPDEHDEDVACFGCRSGRPGGPTHGRCDGQQNQRCYGSGYGRSQRRVGQSGPQRARGGGAKVPLRRRCPRAPQRRGRARVAAPTKRRAAP